MNDLPLKPLIRIAIELREARESRAARKAARQPFESFLFKALAMEPRAVTTFEVIMVSFVLDGKKHSSNDLMSAFHKKFQHKTNPPVASKTAEMAFCEEDNGFYFYNGNKWVLFGHRLPATS